jgi:hypothetical protein
MSPSAGDVVKKARFVFADCRSKPLAYKAVARLARFGGDSIRGRMVVEIVLFADKRRGVKGSRKRSTGKKK